MTAIYPDYFRGRFRYLNAGAWIGRAGVARVVFGRHFDPGANDMEECHKLYFAHRDLIGLDYDGVLMQSAQAWGDVALAELKGVALAELRSEDAERRYGQLLSGAIEPGLITNRHQNRPAVLHTNGGAHFMGMVQKSRQRQTPAEKKIQTQISIRTKRNF